MEMDTKSEQHLNLISSNDNDAYIIKLKDKPTEFIGVPQLSGVNGKFSLRILAPKELMGIKDHFDIQDIEFMKKAAMDSVFIAG